MLRLCAALALLGCIGCGDDEPSEIEHEDGGHEHDSSVDETVEPDAAVEDSGTDSAMPAEPALFALVAQVFADDAANNQSYVVVTDALEGNAMLSLDDGIELAGRAIGVGPVDGGVIFVGGDSGPTLTRYDLQDDGSLEEGDTVSFIGEGVATIGEYGGQIHFVSDDKAYFFDGPTAQMVIWNPEAMTVIGATALTDLVIEGATLTFTASPLVVGSKLITFAGWRLGPAVPSEVGIVVVDTTSDEVTVIRDDRCGYARDGALGDDGMVYVATEAYGAAVHRLNAENAAAPCMLRFDPETSEIDDSFELALNELADGAPTGSLVRGPEGAVFVRVLDENAVEIADDTHPRVLASATAWQWASVALGDAPSLSLLDTEAGGGSVVMQELGEHFIAPLFTGSESTTLVPLTSDGLGEPLATIPGLVFSAVKLR
jgi:hypothetical protein